MNPRTAVTTLPEPELVQDWQGFEPAIRRQEALSGRQAPIPTEVGPRGGRRLAPEFAEWMMWLPEGHVTDVPDLKRAEQLHKIGNGVVPRQAEAALRFLLSI
jgi:DNA (cytosine-5)-methyltransferase 1